MKTIKWIFVALFALSASYYFISVWNSNYDAFLWSRGSKIVFGIITFLLVGGTYNNIEEETNREYRKEKAQRDRINQLEDRVFKNKLK